MVFCSNQFVSYINNLPEILIWNSIEILVTDNTSVVIANSNIADFQSNIKAIFEKLNKWLNLNLLPLKFDKTNFMRFKTKNTHNLDTVIECDHRCISNISYTNFLAITLDSTL
jgi:hypothetical protein